MTQFLKSSSVVFCIAVFALFLTACGGEEVAAVPTATVTVQPSATATSEPTATETPLPTDTPTPEPTKTPTPLPTETPSPEPTATATPEPIILDNLVIVEEGGYAFQPIVDYVVEVNGYQTAVFREDDAIIFFMTAGPANPGTLLEDVLDEFLQTVAASAELEASESYPFEIDGQEGLARDITGDLFGNEIEGLVTVVYMNDTDLYMVFGFSLADLWMDEGETAVSAVIESITFALEETSVENEAVSEEESDFILPLPTGDPLAEWNGLPIMPQAIVGEESEGSYAFTVAASEDEVQQFYAQEMAALGWDGLATGEGETGAILIIFQMEDEVASVSILTVDENTLYVLLVK